MPFTPYHFGLSALPGLTTRGRLDITALITANILIDIEVLADRIFAPGWPVHQLWHFHTLLIGGVVGLIFGATLYWIKPIRYGCGIINNLLGFSYSPTVLSMALSGLIGVWLHVLVDGIYHYDVQVFWPIRQNLFMRWIHSTHWLRLQPLELWVIRLCIAGWITAGIVGVYFCFKHFKNKK